MNFASFLPMAFLILLTSSAFPQSLSNEWHTIDAGGGTSTGGVYALAVTIGQPSARAMTAGGAYSLTSGFWALPVAIPNPEAPTLSIVAAGPGQVSISWAPSAPEFVLQERVSLSAGSWVVSPSGTNNPAIVSTPFPGKFYRLSKP